MRYRREVDGLRAVAVVPVIFFHAGFSWFSGGYVGVDIFFVISGYLITSILLSDLDRDSFSFAKFYERRARRILPALFFVMVCCMPFAWMWMTTAQLKDFSQALVAISIFASNFLFWKKESYFAQPADENPLLHTWSLGVEEQFYIFFPVILVMLWRFGRQPVGYIVFFLTLCSFLVSELGWRHAPSANFYLLPSRAWELGAGSLCAFFLYAREQPKSQIFSIFGLVLIAVSIFLYDEKTPFPSSYALLPVLGSVLIIVYASGQTLVARILGAPIFVGIGLISFGAYLWHQPILAFARIRGFSEPPLLVMGALSVTSFFLAYFSWRYVEAPFRFGGGKNFSRNNIFVFSGMASILIFMIGITGDAMDGVDQRFSLEQKRWAAYIERIREDRQKSIMAGKCHFNGNGRSKDFKIFMENWDCYGRSGLSNSKIAVYGDSHAADKAAALRSVGIQPLQIGGAGCPLIPDIGGPKYCQYLLERMINVSLDLDVETVVLSNRFDEHELSKKYISELIDFWSQYFEKVILFTPMPEFYRFDSAYSFWGDKARLVRADFSSHESFLSAVSEVDVSEFFRIADSSKYFCGKVQLSKCSPIQNNVVMLTDYGHLSVAGASIFGHRFVRDINIDSGEFSAKNNN